MRKLIYTFVSLASLMVATPAWADRACYEVLGMTCATCGVTLKSAVKKIRGVQEVRTSVERKNAVVQYDGALTNPLVIKKAIDDVGYKASSQECKNIEG